MLFVSLILEEKLPYFFVPLRDTTGVDLTVVLSDGFLEFLREGEFFSVLGFCDAPRDALYAELLQSDLLLGYHCRCVMCWGSRRREGGRGETEGGKEREKEGGGREKTERESQEGRRERGTHVLFLTTDKRDFLLIRYA